MFYKNPLNYFFLKVKNIQGDSVKGERERKKNSRGGGGVKHFSLGPSPACLKSKFL